MDLNLLTWLLATTIRMATPIAIAGLGCLLTSLSGIVNLGVEGTMLMGALAGVVGSFWFGSPWIGLCIAVAAGVAVALVYGYVVISLRADQAVAGVAMNLLGLGLTASAFRIIFGISPIPPSIRSFPEIRVPVLSQIPVLGGVLGRHSPLVYLMLVLVPIIWAILMKTKTGLIIRAVGEHPAAVDTAGISVERIRYLCVIVCGGLAGMAGAHLSLGVLNMFTENMTAGRGFIALAAVIFGRFTAAGVLLGALLFGVGDAVQLRLQTAGIGIPYPVLLMIPYLLTLGVLAGLGGKVRQPAASGQPYER